MKIIAHTGNDGVVRITIPVNASVEDVIASTGGVEIDPNALPDMEYQKAFVLSGSSISVDIPKAKQVRLDFFRHLRAQKFTQLDIESIKALEAGDSVKLADISSKKQALRDVTKIPLPDTLEEIKATLPAILA